MHFDIALKELFQSVGTSPTERLAGGVPVKWLNVELIETRAQRLLRMQLQQKFGSISASTEQLLTTATQQQLDRWGTQILSAASVEDVLK